MSGGSRAWSWRHAFSTADLPATTKHVLHTLGMFMNELGEGCYPSVADLCRYSGLDKKTVMKHLSVAKASGWIAVSQHGFRGQRWKRQEYAACWPERDLVAACSPNDQYEGGGTDTPPFEADDVVDFVPQGGGIEGSKVVEHVHQDKTSPITNPITNPSERVRESAKEIRDERKAIERTFKKAFSSWPTFLDDSEPKAYRAWISLSIDERNLAFEEVGRYVVAARSSGRKLICSFAVYLREKRWEKLPTQAAAAPDAPTLAPPFGKMWSAQVYEQLLAGSIQIGNLSPIERRLVDDGKFTAQHLLMEKQAKQGFPLVNELFERAASRRGARVPAWLQSVAVRMVPVKVGDDLWCAWIAEHTRRGWPWPDVGRMEYVHLPAGGPDALNDLQDQLRGLKNDNAS